MGRKQFCLAHGLSVHTLDAWRKRIAITSARQEIVPVEIVANRAVLMRAEQAAGMESSRVLRVVLAHGLRVEVESGFNAAELQRLIAALEGAPMRDNLRMPV
jgi:hypothetical protein